MQRMFQTLKLNNINSRHGVYQQPHSHLNIQAVHGYRKGKAETEETLDDNKSLALYQSKSILSLLVFDCLAAWYSVRCSSSH